VTTSETRRVDLTFGIGYDDDIEKAQRVLEDVVAAHPAVLKDPAPTIRVSALGASSVDFIVRPWTRTVDYWGVYWDLTRQVKQAFDAAGISIPYPQQDVHIKQVAAGPASPDRLSPTVPSAASGKAPPAEDAAAAMARGDG
jgi:small conductance mechanosensitive channel